MSEPVAARPSATVILLREGPRGPEMFMVRRHERSGFANGAYVFPGGSIISADTSPSSINLSANLTPQAADNILRSRGDVVPTSPEESLSYWLSAARELLEEGGVLVHDQVRPVSPSEISSARSASQEDGSQFAEALHRLGVRLDLGSLIYFSHWRTPVQLPKRYDTRFFITAMPEGQVATHCGIETTEALWITPVDALARADAGAMQLVHATRAHIARLTPFPTVDAMLSYASQKTVRCVDPVINLDRSVSIDPELEACW